MSVPVFIALKGSCMGASHIPEQIIDDIIGRIDIVELIAGYIPLKRAGRNFKALCPFHHEKTPSFMVSADKQIFHCFGCQESGNAISFLIKYERLEFREAVEQLAKKAGVVIPAAPSADSGAEALKTQLYAVMELAAQFYENYLRSPKGAAAREYLHQRGISEETAGLFRLGFAPDAWDELLSALRAKNVSLSVLEKAGLVLAKSNGGFYDRFRNRIIFTITDVKARPIGFGARVLDASLPKYLNSPETPVYAKGKLLFGMPAAKDAIRDSDAVIIVEGYLDCIVPHQYGVRNVVASSGTALTEDQVRLLKRYTTNVVMVYDPDDAGIMAMLRALDIFVEHEMHVKVVQLPTGHDPDMFVRAFGAEAFKNKIATASSLIDYKLAVLTAKYNAREIEGKAKIIAEVLPTVKKCKNAIVRSEYLKRIAVGVQVEERALMEELARIKVGAPLVAPTVRQAVNQAVTLHPTEKLLISLLLSETQLIDTVKDRLSPSDFSDERLNRVVTILFGLLEQGKRIDARAMLSECDDAEMRRLICESAFLAEATFEEKERIVVDCVQRLKHKSLLTRRSNLLDQIRAAQEHRDEDGLRNLIREFDGLIRKRQGVHD